MNMSKVIIRILAIALAIFLIGTCIVEQLANDPEFVNETISYEQEAQIGEQIYQTQVLKGSYGPVIQEHYLDSILQVILHRITDKLDTSHYNYTIQIIESPQVNAFTIPGAHIFFYSSMFDHINSAEECAAIIAHEVGHNEHRDMVRRLIQSYGLNVLLNMTPTVVNQMVGGMNLLGFERKQEDQADHFAYKTMVKAGIHPKYFADVMASFESLEQGKAPPEMLSDHPSTARRMKEAREWPVPDDFKEIPINVDWDAFMTRMHQVNEKVEEMIKEEQEKQAVRYHF